MFDINGKLLMKYDNLTNEGQVNLDARNLSSGIYIYSIYSKGEEVATKRMIISK